MPISVSNQAYIFLCSVIGGMIIAFIYDAFRIKRKAVKTRNLMIHIEDFVYWMLVAVVMFTVVYYSNEGEIRGYIFIGTVIGVILYIMLLSKIITESSLFIIKVVSSILKFVWRVVTWPFMISYRILRVPVRFVLKISGKAARKVKGAGKVRLAKAAIWRKIFKNFRKKI